MRRRRVLLVRRTESDVRPSEHQRRAVLNTHRSRHGLLDGNPIVAVDAERVPSVRVEAGGDILAEREVRRPVDRDLIVVVDVDELAERQMTRQRGCFGRHTLHQITVAHEPVDVVVDEIRAEDRSQVRLGDRHTDAGPESLPKGTGRELDPELRVPLGMACRRRSPLAEVPEIVHREGKTGEMKQRVQEHRPVAVRQHEAIAVRPPGIGRIESEELRPHHHREVGHAHRHAGMPGIGASAPHPWRERESCRRRVARSLRSLGSPCLETSLPQVSRVQPTMYNRRSDVLSRSTPSSVTVTMSSIRIPHRPGR